MRVVCLREHGGLDKYLFEDWPKPAPGRGQVLLRVGACGINHLDVFIRRGMPGVAIEFPRIPGVDVAGTVEAVGPGVNASMIGKRILVHPMFKTGGLMGEHGQGGMCEYIVWDADYCLPLPATVSLEEAACLPVAYGAAYRMLITRGRVTDGDLVLILGAGGGVGTACVQIAKARGATVIACAGGAEKLGKLKDLGADHLIDYGEKDFSREAWAISGKRGVDVLVNYTGGDTWAPSLRTMTRGGRLLCCGATAGFDPKTDLRYLWSREIDIRGSVGWRIEDLHALLAMMRNGTLKAVIDTVLPLNEVAEAVRRVEDREVFGKIILKP